MATPLVDSQCNKGIVFPSIQNGIASILISDLAKLSKQLGRSDMQIAKYIGAGADPVIKNGFIQYKKPITSDEIDATVKQFVIDHVLCEQCNNLKTVATSRGRICKSCGHITKGAL